MLPGTAVKAEEPVQAEAKTGEIERMCAELSDVRELAQKLRMEARDIEYRLLGPQPVEEEKSEAANVPSLTGVVGATTRDIQDSLREVGLSFDRIVRELGSIGLP